MNKMDGKSKDLLKENIEQMKQLFPEVCCEDKIDFDKLKQVLGEYVDDDRERYNFTWNGKGRSLRLSQTPSLGTLRPCKEESKDWDSTQNLYIEGDNLEVLKLLQKSYYGKIKMIYIDPPYNTGNDFIYKDDFTQSIESYKEVTGQLDEEHTPITTNSESSGRYHTDWLNMMYPRLRLARNLMSKEGIVFIYIDEHEICNLSKICDEVFGENNSLGTVIWDKRNPKGDSKGISYQHESILIYAKNRECFLKNNIMQRPKKNAEKILQKSKLFYNRICENYTLEECNIDFGKWVQTQSDFSGGEKAYNKIDSKGNVYRAVSMAWPNKNPAPSNYFFKLKHPITGGDCALPSRGWRYPDSTMQELLEKGVILFGKDECTVPNRKYLLKDNMFENITSLLYYGGSDTELLAKLEIPFDTPKVVEICKEHIQAFTGKHDIILDFFSGSATTAHAVMQLNAEDGGNRRFIMVQLPEVCGEKTEAYKAGYKNICEIGKERIRRAGEKIKAEIEEENAQLKIDEEPKKVPDIGFRVFKLDSSNLKKWQPDYDDLEKTLLDSIENYVEGRSELDVVYEIILKMGLDLTYPVDELDVNGRKIYSVAFGALMICLDDHITKEIADGMISLYQEYQPELWKVVFKDNGFENDSAKTNIKEQFKAAGLEEDAFTTI